MQPYLCIKYQLQLLPILFSNAREKSQTIVIGGNVVFHQTIESFTQWNKIAKQTMIVKENQPTKVDTTYEYTSDGHLSSRKETNSLSWKYLYDENGNVVNVNFGIGNTSNEYDER